MTFRDGKKTFEKKGGRYRVKYGMTPLAVPSFLYGQCRRKGKAPKREKKRRGKERRKRVGRYVADIHAS